AAGERGEAKRPVNRHGITHLALATDEYQKDYDHMAAHGVVFNTPPMGEAPGRWAYGRDPFGHVIELLEHSPSSPTALRLEESPSTSCKVAKRPRSEASASEVLRAGSEGSRSPARTPCAGARPARDRPRSRGSARGSPRA